MNKSGGDNRSVRNTKRRLREGLLRLLEQKPINEISVKELTELVDVNRGTFYFHYQDIYDLLRDMEQDFFEQFDRTLNSENPPALESGGFSVFDGEGTPYLHTVFSFIDDNRDFCRIMLSPHGDMKFVELVKRRIDEQCRFFWQILAPGADEERRGMYNAFLINGLIGLIQEWVNDRRDLSVESISELTATLVLASVGPCIS
ncbi:MAG: TetR/AcrR family transcriptional regulator C-terminal domain-containing protein [Oscillospiraceae bacterium]|nr:TetR/AcrR family transcriptional regulator C-terminal domain-containing protein [Oscillospiraceae bacterium]